MGYIKFLTEKDNILSTDTTYTAGTTVGGIKSGDSLSNLTIKQILRKMFASTDSTVGPKINSFSIEFASSSVFDKEENIVNPGTAGNVTTVFVDLSNGDNPISSYKLTVSSNSGIIGTVSGTADISTTIINTYNAFTSYTGNAGDKLTVRLDVYDTKNYCTTKYIYINYTYERKFLRIPTYANISTYASTEDLVLVYNDSTVSNNGLYIYNNGWKKLAFDSEVVKDGDTVSPTIS